MYSTDGRRWLARLLAVAALAFLLAACGDGDSDGDEAAPAAAATDEGEAADDGEAAAGDEATDDGEEAGAGDEAAGEDEADAPTDDEAADDGAGDGLFPDVLEGTATLDGNGTWTFSATLSSPYDTAERYADAWRVVGPDGTVYGVRELAHDHANEQPFTRSLSGVEIPDGIDVVTIEGRDQLNGWGGDVTTVELER